MTCCFCYKGKTKTSDAITWLQKNKD